METYIISSSTLGDMFLLIKIWHKFVNLPLFMGPAKVFRHIVEIEILLNSIIKSIQNDWNYSIENMTWLGIQFFP